MLKGRFTAAGAAEGTIAATITQSIEGSAETCKSGTVKFSVRRPTTGAGSPGAPKAARYYGTTTQRGTGPNRPIVLRVNSNGRRLTRGLFGESVRCNDGKLSIGVEAPRTNIPIDARGRVDDRERFKLTEGETIVHVDDRFTAGSARRAPRHVRAVGPHDRSRERPHDPDLQVGHRALARVALTARVQFRRLRRRL